MEREIKFRAKRVDNGEWITGSLAMIDVRSQRIGLLNQGSMFICEVQHGWQNTEHGLMTGFWTQVLPETVGQYTCLKDCNGVEIYEGDILSHKWKLEVYQNDEGTFMVKYHTNPRLNKPISLKGYLKRREMAKTIERDNLIIGNIYDNPELLK